MAVKEWHILYWENYGFSASDEPSIRQTCSVEETLAVCMVDFVVAGAQKSGTTALRHFLAQHPSIGLMQTGGECHYFDRHPEALEAGVSAEYHAMFTEESLQACTGDVTPAYLYLADCLPRIRRYNPDMKIIVLLRNPIDRAYSQWVMECQKGRETRSFLAALIHEGRYFRRHGQHAVYSYVQRGFYDQQVARLFQHFPRDNCLLLKTTDLWDHHARVLGQVFRFLGVTDDVSIDSRRIHARDYKPMPQKYRRLLSCIFRKDINRLQARLDWDLSDWR